MTNYPEESRGADMREYLTAVRKRKNVIALIVVTVLGTTAFFTFRAPNVYRATTSLIVESGSEPAALPFVYAPMERNLLLNYCELLKSRTLAEQVVDTLKRLAPALAIHQSEDPVKSIGELVSVKPIRETDLIQISAEAESGEEAALIANTIAAQFVSQRLSVVRGEFTEQRRFLEEQLPIIEKKLTSSGETLKEFKESNRLVSLSEETKEQTRKLLEFDLQYGQVQTEYDAIVRRLDYLKEQLAEQRQSLLTDVTQVASPFVAELRKKLVALETDYSLFMVQGLDPDHPKLLALKNSIDEVKENLRVETEKILTQNLLVSDPLSYSQELADKILSLEVEVASLKAKKEALARLRSEFSSRLRSLPEKELRLVALEREYEIDANTHRMLMEKYEEVKIAEAGKIANVTVVDQAAVPEHPVKPRKALNLALGLVLGLGLGLGAAFLLEHLDASLGSLQEVEKLLSIPLMGAVPRIKTRASKKDEVANIASHLITHQVPKSPISETFRSIRTNLQFVNPDDPVKTILVTSSLPGEGKTTVAANLAIVLAQLGASTVLVDSDLRKPVVHKLFKCDSGKGLTDLLMAKTALTHVIRATEIENLKMIPAGSIPPNPSELLGSRRMRSLIKHLKRNFDYVVFDSPPAIPVTDAAVLGSEVDGTLIVVEMGKTDRDAVVRARETLANVRARLIGVIVNNTTSDHIGYSRYQYYHYYRHSYPRARRRLSLAYSLGLFLAGLVSTVGVGIVWYHWAGRTGPRTERAQFSPELGVVTTSQELSLPTDSQSTTSPPEMMDEPALTEEDEPVLEEVIKKEEIEPKRVPEGVSPEAAADKAIDELKIFFDAGKPVLRPQYYPMIAAIADSMKKDRTLQIEVRGYSDSSGDERENLLLSLNRAAVVAARISKVHGVDSRRLDFKGYGSASPLASNSSSEGRSRNRRVEFKVKGRQ